MDADVNRDLAAFRLPDAFGAPITLRHLLTHTVGFDDRLLGHAARSARGERAGRLRHGRPGARRRRHLRRFTYAVVHRRREMGIRLALGTLPAQLMRLVLGDAARTQAWGLTAGLGGALALSRLIRHQLFGTSPLEPAVLAAAASCLAATGMLASWLPAVRARRVDPVREMRAK